MEIRFDPLNEREAEAVAKFLTPTIRAMIHHETPSDMRDDQWHRETAVVDQDIAAMFGTTRVPSTCGQDGPRIQPLEEFNTAGVMVGDIPLDDFHKALREETLKNVRQVEAPSQSAAPLPPDAPLAAAADLFPSAPAVQPVGQVSETSVPTPPAVPAPPQVAAPSAPAAATNPADVDKHGLPWDARIHSGTKGMNADGSWRARRNLNDPELVKRVEAELRALLAVPVSAVPLPPVSGDTTPATVSSEKNAAVISVPPPPPVVSATTQDGSTVTPISDHVVAPLATSEPSNPPVPNVPPPPVVPVPPSSVPATAPIPSPPAVPAPPIAAAPAAPITFADVMRKVTSNIASAKITEAEVHAGLTSIGLQAGEIGKMNGRPELIKAMSDYLDQLLVSKAGV